ncbi:hypothetical protein [Jannaschia sp. M317]|uniref:hypothetical protein n=1 Tax=Jannaschia sp. M317 TaxID=2867011 RepID=UPI0021A51A0A|nr:hypothetical protein [Jannaschia sp. M317]UWQ17076.1 hypothetical protein K3551_14445 [Jannaschia sp. M317]
MLFRDPMHVGQAVEVKGHGVIAGVGIPSVTVHHYAGGQYLTDAKIGVVAKMTEQLRQSRSRCNLGRQLALFRDIKCAAN